MGQYTSHIGQEYYPICWSCRHNRRLLAMMLIGYGQLLAALGAARSQHAASVLSGHALAETMLVHAATIVGLKCSFHRSIYCLYY